MPVSYLLRNLPDTVRIVDSNLHIHPTQAKHGGKTTELNINLAIPSDEHLRAVLGRVRGLSHKNITFQLLHPVGKAKYYTLQAIAQPGSDKPLRNAHAYVQNIGKRGVFQKFRKFFGGK